MADNHDGSDDDRPAARPRGISDAEAVAEDIEVFSEVHFEAPPGQHVVTRFSCVETLPVSPVSSSRVGQTLGCYGKAMQACSPQLILRMCRSRQTTTATSARRDTGAGWDYYPRVSPHYLLTQTRWAGLPSMITFHIHHEMTTPLSGAGLQVWSAALLMCDFVATVLRPQLAGQTVLELGAGATPLRTIFRASPAANSHVPLPNRDGAGLHCRRASNVMCFHPASRRASEGACAHMCFNNRWPAACTPRTLAPRSWPTAGATWPPTARYIPVFVTLSRSLMRHGALAAVRRPRAGTRARLGPPGRAAGRTERYNRAGGQPFRYGRRRRRMAGG